MPFINPGDKHLLFDYAMGLADVEESTRAQHLIKSSDSARDIYLRLTKPLEALDSIEDEACPDDLVEGTLWRLGNLARSEQVQLEQLLAHEQARTAAGRGFWPKLADMLATAAVLVLAAGILIGPLNAARQKSWQQRCQMQLARIWGGINSYSGDHDGRMPSVARTKGSPWWKVGYRGRENHSNTRHMWLLVREGYVEPADFVCPGRRQGRSIQLSVADVKDFFDFPARRYITYSFRISCNKRPQADRPLRKVLIADMNPIFEKLPRDYSSGFNLRLNGEMMAMNSGNHGRRGQAVLFCDGGVDFAKDRRVGIAADDIFTLRNTEVYRGIEVPSCETDAFLAP
jgi:hypothetical protein